MDDLNEFAEGKLWFSRNGDTITIGVTVLGLEGMGNIEDLDLPDPGETYDEGEDCGAVLTRDGELRILTPLALKITEHNVELVQNPTHLEDDPTGDGWILKGEAE